MVRVLLDEGANPDMVNEAERGTDGVHDAVGATAHGRTMVQGLLANSTPDARRDRATAALAALRVGHAAELELPCCIETAAQSAALADAIGTAGVPGVGLIMLSMVLTQVGLPVAGIGLIIGVDRILDMARTAVNVTGDCVVTCIVANSEKQLDTEVYKQSGPA